MSRSIIAFWFVRGYCLEMLDNVKEIASAELRLKWIEFLSDGSTLDCDTVRSLLLSQGLKPKGFDKKSQIRNIYSAVAKVSTIEKVAPGKFRQKR